MAIVSIPVIKEEPASSLPYCLHDSTAAGANAAAATVAPTLEKPVDAASVCLWRFDATSSALQYHSRGSGSFMYELNSLDCNGYHVIGTDTSGSCTGQERAIAAPVSEQYTSRGRYCCAPDTLTSSFCARPQPQQQQQQQQQHESTMVWDQRDAFATQSSLTHR